VIGDVGVGGGGGGGGRCGGGWWGGVLSLQLKTTLIAEYFILENRR
jgi:hypothetical protein